MRVRDQLRYLARLHGMPAAAASEAAERWIERLGLSERAADRVEKLSLGNQQRVQLAAALVHGPEVLVLDEPFSGLDPVGVDVMSGVLAEEAARGVPVLFSSHQLSVVERLCDDVVIISGGRIAVSGARDELRARYGTTRFELVVASDAGWVRDVPGVRVVDVDGPRVVFEPDGDAEVDQVVLEAALRRGSVRSFTPVVPTLDEIFMEAI
jgi:ABC-2 type transport system ATP-binding protein